MSGRRPAFDPSRLDDELDELLPPAPSASPASPPTRTPEPLSSPRMNEPRQPKPGLPKVQDTAGERPQRTQRGAGVRPEDHNGGTGNAGVTVVAVRIPKALYDAVVHDLLGGLVERPSYAQIIAWTCEDHAEEVIAELTYATTTTSARAPRGRKLASDTVPLTLRFQQLAERASLDDVIRRARGEGAKITRTAGVVAALRVAVKQGIPAAAQQAAGIAVA
jgi:hypothetical protein